MYEKILVPLDGSELAERSIPYVQTLAKRLNSEATLLTVCPPGECLERPFTAYLEKITDQLESSGIRWSSLVIPKNNPTDQILRFGEKSGIDLIVLSTHGNSGHKDRTMGKVTREVLKKARVPVLLIRSKESRESNEPTGKDLKKMLVPLDGSKFAEEALSHVKGLAKILQNEVVLLKVVEATNVSHIALREPSFNPTQHEKELRASVEKDMKKYLNKKEKVMREQGMAVSSVTLIGDPAQSILQYAEEHSVDLIALAIHGFSRIAKWAHGSAAYRIIEGSSKPILLVRPPLPSSGDYPLNSGLRYDKVRT